MLDMFSALGVCLALFVASAEGFVPQPQRPIRPFPLKAQRRGPTTDFDLEALEAFEAELDLRDSEKEEIVVEEVEEDSLEAYEIVTVTVPSELHNKRIDAAIAALLEAKSLSRSACGNLVAAGQVYLLSNGTRELLTRKATKVEAGQELEIHLEEADSTTEIVPQELPLDVLFEDEHMIVLNKAANMVVHPAAGNWDGTIVNALAWYLQESTHGPSELFDDKVADAGGDASLSLRPGIVHRLDKGTTGVLVVAKTTSALTALSESFAARRVKKTYLAVTVGNPGKRVTIDKPIGRHPIYRQRMRVVPDPHKKNSSGIAPKDRIVDPRTPSQAGRRALSFVDTLAFDGRLSLVQVRIETGRTHQIRVHLQDRHTPIYGDDVYGLADWNKRLSKTHQISRPLLHAYQLEIEHPVTGEGMVFRAPLASDMIRIANTICPDGATEFPDIFATGSSVDGSVSL